MNQGGSRLFCFGRRRWGKRGRKGEHNALGEAFIVGWGRVGATPACGSMGRHVCGVGRRSMVGGVACDWQAGSGTG
jgi:hypothetical protein